MTPLDEKSWNHQSFTIHPCRETHYTTTNVNFMVTLEEKSPKSLIPPLVTMNVSAKIDLPDLQVGIFDIRTQFHGNSSNSC